MPAHSPMRVAVYARVSTVRQAEADLSIPDQLRQAAAWCAQNGHTIVREYVEPGASGTDENRPVFQEMLADAKTKPRPFDFVLVHSFSRFSRDNFIHTTATRTLKKAGITLHSLSQPLTDDSTGDLARDILANFDAYQSRENGKHTSRAMKENARQGFWNGSVPPFGYQTAEAERRGDKVKKKLAILDEEAAIVRPIHAMYLGMEGRQLGTKAILAQLNSEGVRFRGKLFSNSCMHRILTNETYTGTHHFNVREAKTGRMRPRSEWVAMQVPAIIERHLFERVQAMLADSNPRKTPPRVVSGPILLTGLAVCASCGAGMTLRTGKSGRYRYYTCARRALKGTEQCDGCAVPMDQLDSVVIEALAERVFAPDRLTDLLEAHLDRSRTAEQERRQHLGRLKRDLTETKASIDRLLELVEKGRMDMDDPVFAERLDRHKTNRIRLIDEITLAEATQPSGYRPLTSARLDRLSDAMRKGLREGPIELRRAYIRMVVSRIVVSHREVRISGPRAALAKAASDDLHPGISVPSFARAWRPRRDSNPRPQD